MRSDCDCGRFIELWNLVFIQYHKDEDGNYTPLERPGIDTGMGLERVAAVLQGGAETIFDTDETRVVRDRAAQLACVEYGADHQSDVAIRVITDHVRAAAFMVADGISRQTRDVDMFCAAFSDGLPDMEDLLESRDPSFHKLLIRS